MTAESRQIWWFILAHCLHPLRLEAGPGISLDHEKFPGEFSVLGSQVSEALPLPLPPARKRRDVQPFAKKAGQTLSESKEYSCFGSKTGGRIWLAPEFSVLCCQCLVLNYIHWPTWNILLRLFFSTSKINSIRFWSLGGTMQNRSLAYLVFKTPSLHFQITGSRARLQNTSWRTQPRNDLSTENRRAPAAAPPDALPMAN